MKKELEKADKEAIAKIVDCQIRKWDIIYEDGHSFTGELGLWAAAMANFHQEFDGVGKDAIMQIGGTTGVGHKKGYTTLDEILNTVRPLLAKNGLVPVQIVSEHSVVTKIVHASGQFISGKVNYAEYISENKALAKAQTAGVVITYFKRYSLAAILGISVEEDSDGDEMARKLGTGATQGDSPIEKALKATFVAMKKDADGKFAKDNKWFDPAKTAFVHEDKSYFMSECATPEKLIGWLGKIALQGLCANAANKDAIRAKYDELVKAASAQ
jgi:ERF superfamily